MHASISRWAGTAVLAAAAITATACGTSTPGPSAACQKATAAADAYATWVATSTTYPNDPVSEGVQIMATEAGLLTAMTRAGCPGDTRITTLPK